MDVFQLFSVLVVEFFNCFFLGFDELIDFFVVVGGEMKLFDLFADFV